MATPFTNQAQLSYNDTTRMSNTVVGSIVDTITMTKTAVPDTYTRSDTVTYVINIVNTSGTALSDLTLTDNLGERAGGAGTVYPLSYNTGSLRYFVGGALQSGLTVNPTEPLTITGITVPANGVATIIYDASITEYAPLGTAASIINTATLTGSGLANSLTATSTITPALEPDLSIVKSVSPAAVYENGQLTYTFTISNYGNTAATEDDNVQVTDTFTPILQSLTAELDGEPLTITTDYTYQTGTGAFATVPGKITVPAATFTRDASTGVVTITPGTTTLVVSGTI